MISTTSLYRASVYAEALEHISGDMGEDEQTVFFSGSSRGEAENLMRVLMSSHWKRPIDSIKFFRSSSESELLDASLSNQSMGDQRLFEQGSEDGKPAYNTNVLILAPLWAERLVIAKMALEDSGLATKNKARIALVKYKA
jgi:hypothetical protein